MKTSISLVMTMFKRKKKKYLFLSFNQGLIDFVIEQGFHAMADKFCLKKIN
jgi:hypothetical protein